MRARCIECRQPLGEDGTCPRCVDRGGFIERELRRLRDEIAADRSASLVTAAPAVKRAEEAAPSQEEARAAPLPLQSPRTAEPPPQTPEPPVAPRGGLAPRESSRRRRTSRLVTDGTGLRARELDVGTPEGAREALEEVLEHQRRGLGKVIGLAGLPRHGKTKLADRLRQQAVDRPGVDLRYDKTARGRVNIYYIPGRDEHHVLIDVAGEDFQLLGDYSRELPALMSEFLWPVLQKLDGLLLLLALPIVWSGWNRVGSDRRQSPGASVSEEMRTETVRMVDAHRTLLKYALVARSLRRLRRSAPHLGLSPGVAPSRGQVDDAYKAAASLSCPVVLGFSKADLFAPGETRRGLYSPALPGGNGRESPPLHPLRTDPLALGRAHFPDLFEFLVARVRHFKFDFVQALEDASESPNPQEARVTDAPIDTLIGAESALAFLTGHPWGFPGISTATALKLDRLLRKHRWNGAPADALADPDPESGR